MTNTFKITYASGATSETNSTCESVEAFCNEHFGSTWETAKEHGASVEMVEASAALAPQDAAAEDAPAAEAEHEVDNDGRNGSDTLTLD